MKMRYADHSDFQATSKQMIIGYLQLPEWTPDREVLVRALAGSLCCVLGQDTLLSQCLSPPRSTNEYRRNAGRLPAMD